VSPGHCPWRLAFRRDCLASSLRAGCLGHLCRRSPWRETLPLKSPGARGTPTSEGCAAEPSAGSLYSSSPSLATSPKLSVEPHHPLQSAALISSMRGVIKIDALQG